MNLQLTKYFSILAIFVFLNTESFAQIFINSGTDIVVNNGALLVSNGGFQVIEGNLKNDGFIQVTRLGNLTNNGNFIINPLGFVNGNGIYKVEQDWINDGFYNYGLSSVELYGNLKQFITSNNATQTVFHNLTLTGNGVAENRKKELLLVNSSTDSSGILNLNNRELSTEIQSFHVRNPSVNAVLNSLNFQNEGFVSSIEPGYFVRNTELVGDYFFPLGSSKLSNRYRPILLKTEVAEKNTYKGRLNNYISDLDNYNVSQTNGDLTNLNINFYHSFQKSINSSNKSKIGIAYLPIDGDYSEIGNWNQSNEWSLLENNALSFLSNYKYVMSSTFDFNNYNHPYILANKNYSEDVFVPNSFTPDDGDYNNAFKPIFSPDGNFNSIELTIYNRWGELIHKSVGLDCGWDGKYLEFICQDDTYIWTLVYVKKNKSKKLVGHVNLLR